MYEIIYSSKFCEKFKLAIFFQLMEFSYYSATCTYQNGLGPMFYTALERDWLGQCFYFWGETNNDNLDTIDKGAIIQGAV